MSAERRTRWTDDHGNAPLGSKFAAYCVGDAVGGLGPRVDIFPHDKRLGATGEFVFVLRPEADEYAHMALRWYAHYVTHRDPQLAAALREQLNRIDSEQQP